MTSDTFIKTVRKYTRAKKLSELMLNELIDYIEVHHAERIDGMKTQKLTIHYNCVGVIEVPDLKKIPETEVMLNTRKGVNVTFERLRQAM
jgi:hypothetical protein